MEMNTTQRTARRWLNSRRGMGSKYDVLDIGPHSIEEAFSRLDEAEAEYKRGECLSEQQVRDELKSEFPWLP